MTCSLYSNWVSSLVSWFSEECAVVEFATASYSYFLMINIIILGHEVVHMVLKHFAAIGNVDTKVTIIANLPNKNMHYTR